MPLNNKPWNCHTETTEAQFNLKKAQRVPTCSRRARRWRRGAGSLPPGQGQRLWVWWRNGPLSSRFVWTQTLSWCRCSHQPSAGWHASGRSCLTPPEHRETTAVFTPFIYRLSAKPLPLQPPQLWNLLTLTITAEDFTLFSLTIVLRLAGTCRGSGLISDWPH